MNARITHPTEEELILHFYGESDRPAAIHDHLATCRVCQSELDGIARTLTMVGTPATPERGELYGLEVWQRLRPQLPAPSPWWDMWRVRLTALTAGAGIAALVTAAFLVGRYWPPSTPGAAAPTAAASTIQAGLDDRALTVALVDHLERSERMLVDLANADGADVNVRRHEQASAADLVDANRLYREAAAQAGEVATASVLDDLERTLLDIVHAPSTLTPAELEDVRARLDAAALLFKVRVLSNELREREIAPVASRKTT